jgi:hypothetical protein
MAVSFKQAAMHRAPIVGGQTDAQHCDSRAPRGRGMLIGLLNLRTRSAMDQHLRGVLTTQSSAVADLFSANVKCHIHCFLCVDDCDNRKDHLPMERRANGSVTIIVFYGRRAPTCH